MWSEEINPLLLGKGQEDAIHCNQPTIFCYASISKCISAEKLPRIIFYDHL